MQRWHPCRFAQCPRIEDLPTRIKEPRLSTSPSGSDSHPEPIFDIAHKNLALWRRNNKKLPSAVNIITVQELL